MDPFSFGLGFAAGILFLWIAGKTLPLLSQAWRDRRQPAGPDGDALFESRYRFDTLQYAQGLHVSAVLFSLDEIQVEPRLLCPPAQAFRGEENPSGELAGLGLPYLPDCPELAAAFQEKTLSLAAALGGGANLVLMGRPGSGKTTALAHLASQLARRETAAGPIGHWLPILVHCDDLPPEAQSGGDSLAAIVQALSGRPAKSDPQRLKALLGPALEGGHAILLLDGLDTAPPAQAAACGQLLGRFLERYPQARAVVAASTQNISGLPELGLMPVAMAAWDAPARRQFIHQWGARWRQCLSPGAAAGEGPVEGDLLDAWLPAQSEALTPLELTLKAWSAYAGDALGPGPQAACEAYVRRAFARRPDLRKPVEDFAWRGLENAGPAASAGALEGRPFAPDATLVESGLFIRRGESGFSMVHAVIAAFLAAGSLARTGDLGDLHRQPDWPGKSLLLEMLSARVDLTAEARQAVQSKEGGRFESTLRAARWLRLSNPGSAWRTALMRSLATLIQEDGRPLALRARALVGLANSGEAGVSKLFGQMLSSASQSQNLLGALGSGYVGDGQAVPALSNLIEGAPAGVARAACLALAAIGDRAAIECLAWALVQGGDGAREFAAEALAHHPDQGFALLEEGSRMENLLVRRASIAGLTHIEQPWAIQRIETMSLEDKEWIVRAAAAQALDGLNGPERGRPEPLPGLAETPWLIAFGSQHGLGVSPGRPAEELLRRALAEGDGAQKMAALEYLGLHGESEDLPALLRIEREEAGALREAAYNALWLLAAAGV